MPTHKRLEKAQTFTSQYKAQYEQKVKPKAELLMAWLSTEGIPQLRPNVQRPADVLFVCILFFLLLSLFFFLLTLGF